MRVSDHSQSFLGLALELRRLLNTDDVDMTDAMVTTDNLPEARRQVGWGGVGRGGVAWGERMVGEVR